MNLFTSSIIIVIFFSIAAAGQDCKANVTIHTDVEKVNLFINDIFEDEGNNFNLLLDPGSHKIRIVEDYKKWNAGSIRGYSGNN